MEDITGLGKIADSALANKVYDDSIAKAARESGDALLDVAKTFRLFLAPFQMLAIAQDRLSRFCERVRSTVPPERQIEAAPSIAGPVLAELRYAEEDSPITDLYLNLLRRAIDRSRVDEAHPAFLKIIGQLSPDEAMILRFLSSEEIHCIEYREPRGHPKHIDRATFDNVPYVCQETSNESGIKSWHESIGVRFCRRARFRLCIASIGA